ISRFSFIGIDYLETLSISDDPHMLAKIRELLRRYDVQGYGLPFSGGAVCSFGYDAARVLERIGPSPPADFTFDDAYVVVPGTWVVFDHFTHRVALIGFARDDERGEVERRLASYE